MNYEEALNYIDHTGQFGNKPGLERIEALLGKMGDPQKKLKFVHVAGTNGKGSTCAMVEGILRAAGYKTGLYISPFLENYRERIQVDREMISEEALAQLITEIAEHCAAVPPASDPPRKFEIETAAALKHFADRQCEIVVLEVGLGGRLDATNIIPPPEAAVITSVSHDHTLVLGSRLEQIAFEKCGILKKGSAAVTCFQHLAAAEVIAQRCAEEGLALAVAGELSLSVERMDINGSGFTYDSKEYEIPLIGSHQIQNALTAIETVMALRMRGWNIPQSAVCDGLRAAQWSGRLEVVRKDPLCIIDGAHNQDAVSVLCGVIDGIFQGRKFITVMAMGEDKRYDICAPMLAKRSARFIATGFRTMRPAPAAEIAKAARRSPLVTCEPLVIPDTEKAVRKALELAGPDDVVLACGSLYMIGDAKRFMVSQEG